MQSYHRRHQQQEAAEYPSDRTRSQHDHPRNAGGRHRLRRFTSLLSAFLGLALVTSLAACGSDNAQSSGTTLRVAYLSTANYLTTLQYEDFAKNSLSPAHITWTGPYSPSDAYAAVQSGNADASSTGTGHFVDLIAEQQPWVAFALEYYDGDSQGIVAAPGSNITSLKGLYGKSIAIDSKGGTGDYIVNQAFAHAGLDVSKVNKVEMKQTDFASAFTSGKVDALASFDQNLAMAISTPGAKLLTDGSRYESLNVSIHMVSKRFAQEHPDVVKKLYQALKKESDKAQTHPSIITDAYRKFGASDTLTKVVAGFDTPEIRPIDAQGLAQLNKQAEQYRQFGFIDHVPDLSAAVIDCSGKH
ncbi:ABC transporter substrate-binding protein [Bifidobacterium psychraerophilum]|uniref:ABC transporter substrate-binding protein n=1 Tax=Bifidobacterium psychraerophilum TaxID=218140 RepID=UPI0023F56125|nr:NrtA/SsuA/CpmA family ABC transporter substrate-binding protein [Bifidobacterium psychraerophilum]MCI1660942.1 NrtA/SsuA/CpmA family ABC transporter substrate-binding protein [Bifidobacterium psychraerophilum]MCI1805445.1 NrtA/SsuA/CpmA family ABC transporter substrate-binding protein [Bifidobacterium psychraerophilum]MCI2177128.1 NrtA/SsuA/CpmA family ABC transporter substrate-binding protein [Bifidobacterium psychraerophilum]MCI2182937.1 NrtA/SsuA/CpmA family ABC transporter substrate-bind